MPSLSHPSKILLCPWCDVMSMYLFDYDDVDVSVSEQTTPTFVPTYWRTDVRTPTGSTRSHLSERLYSHDGNNIRVGYGFCHSHCHHHYHHYHHQRLSTSYTITIQDNHTRTQHDFVYGVWNLKALSLKPGKTNSSHMDQSSGEVRTQHLVEVLEDAVPTWNKKNCCS